MAKHEPLALNLQPATRETLRASFFFVVVLLIVYWPSFSGVWIYDDEDNILKNSNIHIESINFDSLTKAFYFKSQTPYEKERILRPLSYLSFALNWYFGQIRVFGYHLVNFSIHLTATLFLYLFIKKTLTLPIFTGRYIDRSHLIAFLSAMIWAMHPIQVTAVTYIVQRMASMAGMFTIISMYTYLNARTGQKVKKRVGYGIACGLSGLCAFATKENSAMLPVSLLAIETMMIRGIGTIEWKKLVSWGAAASVLVILLGLFYLTPQHLLEGYSNRPFTPWERVMTEPRVILYYIKMLFYPLLSEMTLVHDVTVSTSLLAPWTTLPAMILLPLLFILALFWIAPRWPLAGFATVFFLINHAIEGSFVCLELFYEHRNYLPSMLLFIIPSMLFVYALDHFVYHRRIQTVYVISGAVIFACLGHSTHAYNSLFCHQLVFWRDNSAKSGTLSVVQNNYANELMKAGKDREAHEALQRAVAADRYFNLAQEGVTLHNMGLYYERYKKNLSAALAYYQQSAAITSGHKSTDMAIARYHLANQDSTAAKRQILQALEKWPNDPDLFTMMGKIDLLEGNIASAIDHAQRARRVLPGGVAPLALLGDINRVQANLSKAVFFWQAYQGERPDSAVAALVLMQLYHETGDWEKLNNIVATLMVAKGERAWPAWLQEIHYQVLHSASVFSLTPEEVQEIVSQTLERESRRTAQCQ